MLVMVIQAGHVEVDWVAGLEEAAGAEGATGKAVSGHTRQPKATRGIKQKRGALLKSKYSKQETQMSRQQTPHTK